MGSSPVSRTCLLLNVGMVARGSRCLSIMKNLHSMKPSGLRLVGIANIQKSTSCFKFAEEMGLEVYEDYEDLLKIEYLDLVLELTGDEDVLTDIIMRKPATVGVLDRQASLRLMDMARIYAQVDRNEAETPLASTLLEASPDGVMVINRKYRILNCNKSPLIPGSENGNSIFGRHCFEVLYRTGSPCQAAETGCPAQETGKPVEGFTHKALDLLASYHWPGNIRELRNVVERAVVIGRGRMIGTEELTFLNPRKTVAPNGAMTLLELETSHIRTALDACNGNVIRASRQLGIDRSTLMRKMKRYQLDRS